ncbi:Thioredoxin-dependent peroxide reductase, mitochondrial [Habropoda laboriosa]|uniref:thioredoxin-dependent peroxiredoxin n=1 Tax=Habropoda laboriosa TaxID=597456 RepID=A0A0L7RJI5_9HYME|nr:Thioredoxin-dependent peroxide reductase, mitochondrial [Habropoda laboriosa]
MLRLLACLRPQTCKAVFAATSSFVKTKHPTLVEHARNFCVSTNLFSCQLQIQQPAPEFSGTAVVDGGFEEIKLSDYKGKYVVLFFYPLDFTFVCPTELIAFSEKIKEFKALNTQVIGASTDSHFSHLAWTTTPRKQGGLGGNLDKEGILRHLSVNDLPVGRSVDETLRLIKAFQFVEKHGEVCPANWQPDSKTIKPNPKDSKEYFESVN